MTKQFLSRTTGLLSRGLRTSTTSTFPGTTRSAPRRTLTISSRTILAPLTSQSRFLSTTSSKYKGILPDSSDPTPPNVQDHAPKPVPAELTDEEYHELADEYLEVVLAQVEAMAEKNEAVEVEYSVCSCPHPPPNPFPKTNRHGQCLRSSLISVVMSNTTNWKYQLY